MRAGKGWYLVFVLELELQTKLQFTRIVSRRDLTEVASPEVVSEAAEVRVSFKLRVVPDVEGFDTELELHSLGESEILQERKVPILAAGTGDGVESQITVAIRA